MELGHSIANFCSKHSSEKIQFFCLKCKKVYCSSCYQADKTHTVKDLPKELISNYEFEDFVCNGRCGFVFKAKNMKTGDLCALKLIPIENDDDIDVLKGEIEIHSQIVHSNIIRYVESFGQKTDNLFVIVMELAQNSLSTEMKTISQETALIYFRQIMEALHYLHENMKIIHRDIKPGNILVKDGIIKLCDMGEAKIKEKSWLKLSAIDGFGTRIFQSPEVMNGRKYNEKNDIWAAGIIFHMMLSQGKYPFWSRKEAEIVENVMKENLKFDDAIKDQKHLDILQCMFKFQRILSLF